MFCTQCGTGLPDHAEFCSSCGARQSVAAGGTVISPPPVAAPPPMPTACPSCGAIVQPGRSFCTHCGHSMTVGASANPVRPAAGQGSFETAELVMAAGFVIAVVATLLEWVSFGPEGVSGWNTDSRFRIAEWLGVTAPIDAAIIAVAAGVGALVQFGPRFDFQAPSLPLAPTGAGALIAAVGVLEWLYIDDIGQGIIDPGIGIYGVIVGGLLVASARFLSGLKLS